MPIKKKAKTKRKTPKITVVKARTRGALSWEKGTYVVQKGSRFLGAYKRKTRAEKSARAFRRQGI